MTHHILVIDKEPSERNVLCSAIHEKLSYKTTECDSESEAISYLSTEMQKPEMILFDISRTTESREKITTIKTACKNIPIVVLTKYGDYDMAMTAIDAGAYDFLSKPVAIERMYVTFRNAILYPTSVLDSMGTQNVMTFSLLAEDGNVRKIHDLEREAIMRAIRHYDGCMAEVARRLGIGRSTLYRKISYSSAA